MLKWYVKYTLDGVEVTLGPWQFAEASNQYEAAERNKLHKKVILYGIPGDEDLNAETAR